MNDIFKTTKSMTQSQQLQVAKEALEKIAKLFDDDPLMNDDPLYPARNICSEALALLASKEGEDEPEDDNEVDWEKFDQWIVDNGWHYDVRRGWLKYGHEQYSFRRLYEIFSKQPTSKGNDLEPEKGMSDAVEFAEFLRKNNYHPSDKSDKPNWIQFGSKIGWLQPGMSIVETTEQLYEQFKQQV